MKRNKYIVKYTVPNRLGENNIYYTFIEIICSDNDTAKDFYERICKACVSELQELIGVTVESGEIDFKMISLVDSVAEYSKTA